MKIVIYPAGGVKKGKEDSEKISWTEKDMETVKKILEPHEVFFIDPRFRNEVLQDQEAVFGRDLLAVKSSDFVIVDARQKRGIGVGQEMLFAKINEVPVVTIAPEGGHYSKKKINYLGQEIENYKHPFILGTSDAIVENFQEAGEWIKNIIKNKKGVKGFGTINHYMSDYIDKFYKEGDPLKEVLGDKIPITRDFVTATFVVNNNKVLLIHHKYFNKWLPPGGHIDLNEIPTEAAIREVKEETGLDVELLGDEMDEGTASIQIHPKIIQLENIKPGHQHIDLVYFAKPKDKLQKVIFNEHETNDIKWFTAEELQKVQPLIRKQALQALKELKE